MGKDLPENVKYLKDGARKEGQTSSREHLRRKFSNRYENDEKPLEELTQEGKEGSHNSSTKTEIKLSTKNVQEIKPVIEDKDKASKSTRPRRNPSKQDSVHEKLNVSLKALQDEDKKASFSQKKQTTHDSDKGQYLKV